MLRFKFKLPRNVRVYRRIGIKSIVRVSWEEIIFLWMDWSFDEEVEVKDRAPCPPINSSHPWSRVFKSKALVDRGDLIINWEEIGVRNHIIQEAALCSARFRSVDLLVERSVELFQNMTAPMIVTAIANSFRCRGRNISGLGVRISQLSEAPPVIAAVLRSTVGVDKKKSESLILCNGREQEGAHIVAARNRAV